ncbi:MAG: class IV adenylate cyclase [Candidatus Eisenbacteria bacterium]
MARNIEIKARIRSIADVITRVAAIATDGPTEIVQDDIFFDCDTGRLKLRILSEERGELIYYRRADQQGPKESFYLLSPTESPYSLLEVLSLSNKQAGRVEKHRTLFLAGRTRIHLDCVKGLGDFLELEVVLDDGKSAETGIAEAHAMMEQLGIDESQLVEGAYVDLLAQRPAPNVSAKQTC